MISDPKLKRWVNHCNAEYFDGELPNDITIFWEPCGPNAATTTVIDEQDDPLEFVIRVDPGSMGFFRHAKRDIVHELVHVKQWKQRHLRFHGRRFDEELQRLCQFRSYRKLL